MSVQSVSDIARRDANRSQRRSSAASSREVRAAARACTSEAPFCGAHGQACADRIQQHASASRNATR